MHLWVEQQNSEYSMWKNHIQLQQPQRLNWKLPSNNLKLTCDSLMDTLSPVYFKKDANLSFH